MKLMMKGVFRCTAIILTHEPIRGNPRRQNGPADEGGVLIEKTNSEKVERAAYTAPIGASDLEKRDLSVLHSEGNR